MPLIQKYAFCDGCGVTAQEPDVHIQACAKCRVAQYCSRSCQSRSWKSFHKHECRKPEEAISVSRRAVARFGVSGLGSRGGNPGIENPDSNKVYYLKISRPWVNDICISGPYEVLEATYANIAHNFRFSRAGMAYLEEMHRQQQMEDVVHIQAPLDADAEKIITVEIITKENAELRAALPCPVWNVSSSEPVQSAGVQQNALGFVPLESMDLVGSYLTRDGAIAALKKQLKDEAEEFRGCKTIAEEINGQFVGMIVRKGVILRTFQVAYDSGVMGPTEFVPM